MVLCRTDIVASVGYFYLGASRSPAEQRTQFFVAKISLITKSGGVFTPGITCHVQTEMSRLMYEELCLAKRNAAAVRNCDGERRGTRRGMGK